MCARVDVGSSQLKALRKVLERLQSLEWKPTGQLDPEILNVVADVGRHPRLIYDAVNSWSVKDLEKRQLSCHETATHYKWFIYYDEKRRFKVWLHQYKTEGERSIGYAEIPHNHRYSLASVVLSGGFTHHYFDIEGNRLSECIDERRTYGPGDAYVVAWQRVHKLSELVDSTLTFVIESPPVREYSEAFYSVPGKPRVFYDFVARRPRLARELDLLCQQKKS